MDRVFEHGGTSFCWDESKAAENHRKHGVSFEEAVTVFDDPLLVLQDASRNEEQRDAVIGFSSAGRLLTVVLADALKRRGVTEKVLQEAMKEIAENS